MSEQTSLDTLGMWEAVTSLPERLSGALQVAGEAFGDTNAFGGNAGRGAGAGAFRSVAAFGLGTGGTACAAAAALTAPDLAVPFWFGTGSAVPAFVGPDTLVLAVSSSGRTAETLVAAEKAVERGATVVAVGGDAGGALARLAGDAGLPWCPSRSGAAVMPARSALGGTTVAVLVALARAGLRQDCSAAVTGASAALARRRDSLVAPGAAPADLARRLGRTIPLVYGATGVAAVAAGWWKAQVNLNAKAPAFAAAVPQLTHEELAGWGQGGDVTRQTMSLVLLRLAGDGPRTAGLFDAVRAATDEVMADIFEVHGEGDDELSRFFDLTLFGELVSLHLAAQEGVDPGPVPAVDEAQAAALLQ